MLDRVAVLRGHSVVDTQLNASVTNSILLIVVAARARNFPAPPPESQSAPHLAGLQLGTRLAIDPTKFLKGDCWRDVARVVPCCRRRHMRQRRFHMARIWPGSNSLAHYSAATTKPVDRVPLNDPLTLRVTVC